MTRLLLLILLSYIFSQTLTADTFDSDPLKITLSDIKVLNNSIKDFTM